MARSRVGWVVVAAVLCGLGFTAPAHAEAPISENASRRFAEGVRHLRTNSPDRYAKAYIEFKAAHTDSPSWKILGNLGIVAQELERYGEAIDAFERYLAEGGRELSAAERAQVTSDLALLRADHSTINVVSTPDGAWIVDERLPEAGAPVINRYGPAIGPLSLRLRPGHHRVHAELSGYSGETWELNPTAGSSSSHVFELSRSNVPNETPPTVSARPFDDELDAERGKPELRMLSYVSFGLGAVSAGAGGVLLGLALDKKSDSSAAVQRCNGCDVASTEGQNVIALQETEGDYRTGALASFIGAGAFIAGGIVCFVLSSPNDEHGSVAVVPLPSLDGIAVTGRF